MKKSLLLLTLIYCQFSFGQKRDLYIVLEKPFKNEKELNEKLNYLTKNRIRKKYNTVVYYGGNRKFKTNNFENIELRYQGSFCNACDLLNSLNLDSENSYQVNNISSSCQVLFNIERKEVNRKLKKERKNNISKGILLFEAKEKPVVKLINIPERINTSKKCDFAIQSNSFQSIQAKIWVEQKDLNGNWEGTIKKDIEVVQGITYHSLELNADSKIVLEFSNSIKSVCQTKIESSVIYYKFFSEIYPVELIHEGNATDDAPGINIYTIDQKDIFNNANCGASLELLPEANYKYFFYTKKQNGIKSIKMMMQDLCTDGNLYKCNTNINPVELLLEKDLTFNDKKYDRFIIDMSLFYNGPRFSCEDYMTYNNTNKNNTPVREWEITLIPNLDKYSFLSSRKNNKYKIRFNQCNGK